jgi:hypothetical protein
MGASEWGKPPKALRAKGVEKEEEEEEIGKDVEGKAVACFKILSQHVHRKTATYCVSSCLLNYDFR